MDVDNEQEQEGAEEDFQAQINAKIKNFFESTPYIKSREELDSFLTAIELKEIWGSEEEKDTVWESISKYSKDSKIDCEGALQGINDLLNAAQEDDEGEDVKEDKEENGPSYQRKETKEKLLTRLSRISNIGIGSKSGNKLALNRYKQRAIEQYDSLDSNSLIQFKKIFVLLKITKSNNRISFDELKEICDKSKFIKLDINDIWKYLSYCVYEEKLSNLENQTEFEINNDIMEEVKDFINQKLINEDIEDDSDMGEEDAEDKNDTIEEISLNLIEKIIKQSIEIKENNNVLNEIKNEVRSLNKDEIDNNKELINEKITQIDEFIQKTQKDNSLNLKKMESLKNNILRITENIKSMKEDYKDLFEKYNSNQQVDIDEVTERLLDENMMLNQEKENKEQEISNLLEEKKEMKKDYQNMQMQYEDVVREKNELTMEMSEIKMNNYKLKNDYEKLLNDIVNKMDKEKKNKKNVNINSNVSYEDQVKEIRSINNSRIDDGEKISRKKDIFNNMTNEKLINYIMEIERVNQTLSNEKSNNNKKIQEITQKNVDLNNLMKIVKDRNIELEEEAKNLQKKIDNLNSEVKNNEVFRPSISINSNMRVSRLSKLNTPGLNAAKFNKAKAGNFNNKKNIEKFKLKDKNINQKLMPSPTLNKMENISLDLYGVKEEVDDEEEDPDNKKIDKNKKDEQSGFNIQEKKNNNMDISSNSGIGFGDQKNQNNKMEIGGKTKNNFGMKTGSKNAYEAFNINLNSKNSKGNLELDSSSSGMLFDGTNKDINLSQQSGIEMNINQNSNNTNEAKNGEVEVENINDINLSSGNNINFGDITSSVINFDIKNNNNIINENSNNKTNNNFETTNNNIFLQNEKNNAGKNNNQSQAQSGVFFEGKSQNNDLDLKKKESTSEEIKILKIDNLLQEMPDEEENDIKEEPKNKNDNQKINEIQNENNININNIKNDDDNNNNDENLQRNRIDTVFVNNQQNNQNQNLETIILTGIEKEGFNIGDSSVQKPLSSSNSNNININGENNNNNENNINQIILDKSNENEIIINDSNNNNNKIGNEVKSNFSSSTAFNIDLADNKLELFPSINLSESSGKPIQYNRLSKVELDELRNNNYDYYSLFQEDYIQRRLKEEKDKCNEFNMYSDQIYQVIDRKHINKKYIVITPSHIYLIEPKEMRFTHIIKKENIISFQISNKNVNIIMFQITGGDNILIETLRRMDLLSYLRDTYRNSKNPIKIKYEDKFDIKVKGKVTTILVKDKVFSNFSNFDGAQKIGYLFLYKGTYIMPIFKEKLFVLTSIGLIMFDEPSSPPSKLYPIIGSTIAKIEGTRYGRENCFQITCLSGKVKVFATRKKRERDSWLKEFDKINKEFQNKMKQLDTINKKMMGKEG